MEYQYHQSIVAVFDNRSAAESARNDLIAAGVSASFVATGAVISAWMMRWVVALMGTASPSPIPATAVLMLGLGVWSLWEAIAG